MRRLALRMSCFFAFLLLVASVSAQSEFSAEIVNDNQNERGPTKVYFGKDKIRFDSQDNRSEGGAVILDLRNESYVVLMQKQHMYMEMPAQMMENRGMFSFFKSGDVENACPDWLKLARNKGGSCHKIGSETVNGRSTVKYEGTNSEGESSTVWLDSKVRFPVKWVGKNGSGGLRNIQEGAQPASLFEVPTGYTKMDMGGMMQQMQPQH
ncbi:MAG TPA: hypothetical protein VMU61_05340 [Candidatus Aquilonibacter sp.]|nr:hypothetical protein [Candidatus Aquilonibacter sp.]